MKKLFLIVPMLLTLLFSIDVHVGATSSIEYDTATVKVTSSNLASDLGIDVLISNGDPYETWVQTTYTATIWKVDNTMYVRSTKTGTDPTFVAIKDSNDNILWISSLTIAQTSGANGGNYYYKIELLDDITVTFGRYYNSAWYSDGGSKSTLTFVDNTPPPPPSFTEKAFEWIISVLDSVFDFIGNTVDGGISMFFDGTALTAFGELILFVLSPVFLMSAFILVRKLLPF